MFIARIDGTITATAKHKSLVGQRLLIGQRIDVDGGAVGEPLVLVDTVGAGLGSIVMVSSDGDLARRTMNDPRTPARMMTVGIVDEPCPRGGL